MVKSSARLVRHITMPLYQPASTANSAIEMEGALTSSSQHRYHSTTYAIFPDETHNSIRRTFNTPQYHPALPPTRRQFCGYCGTHLTAWNEAEAEAADYLDVTLGSLLNDSLAKLETLNIIPDTDDDEDGLVKGGWIDDEDHIPVNDGEEGLVKGGWVDDEDHIPVKKDDDGGLVKGGWIDDEDHIPMGGVEGPGAVSKAPAHSAAVRRMRNRGIPYFEEMVENSRLGRIKRQKGGHTSQDGRTTVQWEVVEIDNSEPSTGEETAVDNGGSARAKRQKTNP